MTSTVGRETAIAMAAAGVKHREAMGELRPAFEALAVAAAEAIEILAPLFRWAHRPEIQKQIRRQEINQRQIAQALRYRDQRTRRRR